MSDEAVRFLTSMAQAVSTMNLYADDHPARQRAIDRAYEALCDLQQENATPLFTFLGAEIVLDRAPLRELRHWDWGPRLAAAGIQRLEFDGTVSRDDFDAFLEDAYLRLERHADPQRRGAPEPPDADPVRDRGAARGDRRRARPSRRARRRPPSGTRCARRSRAWSGCTREVKERRQAPHAGSPGDRALAVRGHARGPGLPDPAPAPEGVRPVHGHARPQRGRAHHGAGGVPGDGPPGGAGVRHRRAAPRPGQGEGPRRRS